MKYDCIIVLANEMDINGNLNAESLGRINLACEQYFNKVSDKLITCGWDYRKDSELFIGNVLKSYAINLGVPAEVIIAELNSRDTVGDAFFTKVNIIEKTNWKNLLVVTSDYHVLRTAKIFNFIYGPSYEINVIGAPGSESAEKKISEEKSTIAFENTFKGVEPGNDKEIFERLSNSHPFYNGKIYSKITL